MEVLIIGTLAGGAGMTLVVALGSLYFKDRIAHVEPINSARQDENSASAGESSST